MSETNQAWRCTVCGYVHRGSEPPEACPVCSAPADLFEAQIESLPTSAPRGVSQWRCLVCGYVHAGLEPPADCPVCGALSNCFEPASESAGVVVSAGKKLKVVVVGAGIAGLAAVESLRTASPTAEITLVSKEPELPYYRLNLTRYLAGEIGEQDLPIHPASWYDAQKVRLKLGVEASAIHLKDHVVELHNGEKLPFDKLLLTTGSHPLIPSILGADLKNVTSLRTVGDTRRILV